MNISPAIIEAKQKVLAEKKKARRGLWEIAAGVASGGTSIALMVTDPFREIITTPGTEHYVGGVLKYGTYVVGGLGILLLAKGIYDVVEHGLTANKMERQLGSLRDDLRRRTRDSGYSNGVSKSRPLDDPEHFKKLRTKNKRPPINPLLL